MKTVNLASGSKGNSTYIESTQAKILVDCGLNLKNIELRLNEIEVNPNEIDAILLTHEHIDHILGVKSFLKKYKNTKVYIPSFVKNYSLKEIIALPNDSIVWFNSSEFFIKDVLVSCFLLPHDSCFCVGYSLYFSGIKVSVATDLGYVPQDIIKCLEQSDILYLESNHDENLLKQNPRYPAKTKNRILGKNGHLSNKDCAYTLVKIIPTGVKQVILSHLSGENNTPNLAYTTIKKILFENNIIEGKNVCVDVCYQERIGTIFNLD